MLADFSDSDKLDPLIKQRKVKGKNNLFKMR